MTDKVRMVRVSMPGPDASFCRATFDSTAPTHMLVPVEAWEIVIQALEFCSGTAFSKRANNHAKHALAEVVDAFPTHSLSRFRRDRRRGW
jgi:hypothetical protein